MDKITYFVYKKSFTKQTAVDLVNEVNNLDKLKNFDAQNLIDFVTLEGINHPSIN